jgi:GDP-L-fucose synthase
MTLTNKKILVTGAGGFLGKHLVAALRDRGVSQIHTPDSTDADLRIWECCNAVVTDSDVVIHLAAKVGGIGFNRKYPGELLYDNAIMGLQLMEAARQAGVQKFVAVGTVCAYPKFTPTPFKEDDIWNGYPEETNAPYGIAKKLLLAQAQAYRNQYGFNAIYLLPTNIYGPGDHVDPEDSHVIPALFEKVKQAKKLNAPYIECWGTGSATRDFLFVKDAAEGIIKATDEYDGSDPVNLGSGRETSIKELTQTIRTLLDYKGEIRWDATKPDGQPRRVLDTSRAETFGFKATTSLEEGLRQTLDYIERCTPRAMGTP